MVDEFTFKTGVTTSGTISIFHSGEGVVFEVRIGLYGGDVRDFYRCVGIPGERNIYT